MYPTSAFIVKDKVNTRKYMPFVFRLKSDLFLTKQNHLRFCKILLMYLTKNYRKTTLSLFRYTKLDTFTF